MNVVIAIDSFKGSLSSLEAGESAANGIKKVYPDATTVIRPLADGGEGTVDALVAGCGGKMTTVSVTGPLGETVSCQYGIVSATKTAIIEMAVAAGITLVPPQKRNPLHTTTYGVGEIIADAVKRGCRHFLIGIGGSVATYVGGIGNVLQATRLWNVLDENGNQWNLVAKGPSPAIYQSQLAMCCRSFQNMYIPCCLRCHKSTLRLYWLLCCFWTAKGS